MTDEQLKALINKKISMHDLVVGDYARIVNVEYNSRFIGQVRKIAAIKDDLYSLIKVDDPHVKRWWDKDKLEPATREEYVAYMEGRGLAYD